MISAFENFTVAEFMSESPESLSCDQTIGEATRFLLEERIHGAPVVGRDGCVIGVLSSTDILKAISEKLFEDQSCEIEVIRQLRQTGIGIVVTPGAVTCSPETSVAKACRLMAAEHVHRLVVTSNDVPIGIFSPSDVVRAIAGRCDAS
jgi:predicted transcriptional regulator